MIRAYSECYLNDAMGNLGEAFDYAVNKCGQSLDSFMDFFIAGGFADRFGKGEPKIISGLSGTELAVETIARARKQIDFPAAQIEYERSPEYWCGWILAFYQWHTATPFRDIHTNMSMEEMLALYPTHHEAAEEKFVDTMNAIFKRKKSTTKLQIQRKRCGYSQRTLSEKSGVNIRTLQQYELGSKDIGKASIQTVLALANVLGCKAEDLVENTI